MNNFKLLIVAIMATAFSGCGFSSDSCELAIRTEYENNIIWTENVAHYRNLVLTKDSVLILITSSTFSYPYYDRLNGVDTLDIFSKNKKFVK